MTTGVVEGFRISPQQRRLWRLGGLPPATVEVRVDGPLDVERLRDAAARVVADHEILRTAFRAAAGMTLPVQRVLDDLPPVVREDDLSCTTEDELDGELRRRRRSGPVETPEDGWPLHLDVLRLPAGRCTLLVRLPALCADATGAENVVRELAAAYAGRNAPEPLQYADLAEVLNELQEGEEAAAGLRYWADLDPLGAARPLPPPVGGATGEGRSVLRVPPSAAAAAERCAADLGAPLAAWLLAVWRALLHRLTGVSSLAAGVVLEGRNYEGLDRALGPFARLLPLVSRARPEEPVAELARRAAADVADAEEWQDAFDWERLADGSPPEAATAFEHRPAPPALDAGECRFAIGRVEAPCHRAGVALTVHGDGTGMEVEVRVRAEGRGPTDARWLAGRYLTALASACGRPEAPLADHEILAQEERLALLVERNDTGAELPRSGIVARVVERAAEEPQRAAVRCGDATLTYGRLAQRAGALAARLAELGAGEETVVGICSEAVPDAVVALLAVQWCGAAFLPLDPAHPAERLAGMVDDAGAIAVLATPTFRDALPPLEGSVHVVDPSPEAAPDLPPPELPAPAPRRLAYVLYTSGSTGRPKGVEVEEGSLLNYLAWARRRLLAGPVRHLPVVTRLSFDACLKQILAPLSAGDAVWMVPPEVGEEPAALLAELGSRSAAGLNCVPSLWRGLLDAADAGLAELPALAGVMLGGEEAGEDLVERTRAALPAAEIWNLYGPTEVTANASAALLSAGGPTDLGRPVDNARVYLLDPRLRPVPAGVEGEIHVAGAGVARGYRNHPGLTAEAFVPDPFEGAPGGGRLYRTGDRGRLRADGVLEFLGRSDDQVKIRGFRLELGEVEALLREHPGVSQSAALVVEEAGEPRLAAVYAGSADEGVPEPAELARWLAGRAPEHAVPSRLVEVDELPLMPSGKVDRAALAARVGTAGRTGSGDAAGVAPRTLTEERLASIWSDLLGVGSVGAFDNFYALGGHSLLAIQLLSRVRTELDAEIPMSAVLDAEHLAALAERVDAASGEDGPPPVEPRPADAGAPLSFAEEKLWFLAQLDTDSPAYNIPAALRFAGTLRVPALEQGLAEVERRHEVLRSTYPAAEGQPVRRLRPAEPEPLPVVDLGRLPAAVQESEFLRLAEAEARRPFDLAAGPMLRRRLLELGTGPALLTTSHHIVSDGWSTGVLMDELSRLYTAFGDGRPSPLQEPSLQYADYAHWQRRELTGERADAQVEYWRRRLADLDEELLEPDQPRRGRPTTRGATLYAHLPTADAETLAAVARQEEATLFMALLAAFKVLLAAESGRRDVAVGTDVVNRERTEVRGLLGFFVNQVVLRTDLSGEPTFRELVRRVRATALGAYAHQELPFHQLVSALQLQRDLGRNPLFQVMFSMQNAPRPERSLGGVPFEPVRAETDSSVFDLSLYVFEEPEGEGLPLALRYDSDLFRATTMRRLLQRYTDLVSHVAADPETTLDELFSHLRDEARRRADEAAEVARASASRLRRGRRRTADHETETS